MPGGSCSFLIGAFASSVHRSGLPPPSRSCPPSSPAPWRSSTTCPPGRCLVLSPVCQPLQPSFISHAHVASSSSFPPSPSPCLKVCCHDRQLFGALSLLRGPILAPHSSLRARGAECAGEKLFMDPG